MFRLRHLARPVPRTWKQRRPSLRPENFSTKTHTPRSISRIDRINSRLPKFLRRYTALLHNAAATHITAFLLLHELTAVVPLFGLAGMFHYWPWLLPDISDSKWVKQGIEKYGNYFKKKGWIGKKTENMSAWWERRQFETRVVVEFSTAYAITKALLPLRIMLSVWATPWFARVFIAPCASVFSKAFGSKKSVTPSTSPAAGTGATAGGVITKRTSRTDRP